MLNLFEGFLCHSACLTWLIKLFLSPLSLKQMFLMAPTNPSTQTCFVYCLQFLTKFCFHIYLLKKVKHQASIPVCFSDITSWCCIGQFRSMFLKGWIRVLSSRERVTLLRRTVFVAYTGVMWKCKAICIQSLRLTQNK